MSLLVPTTSMGDIAFLLIIFFILAGNFMKNNMKLTNPLSPDVEQQEIPQVTVVMDEAEELWFQGERIDISQLTSKVQDMIGDRKDRPVHVKIHKTIERKTFLPVIEALSEAGVKVILAGDKGDAS